MFLKVFFNTHLEYKSILWHKIFKAWLCSSVKVFFKSFFGTSFERNFLFLTYVLERVIKPGDWHIGKLWSNQYAQIANRSKIAVQMTIPISCVIAQLPVTNAWKIYFASGCIDCSSRYITITLRYNWKADSCFGRV